MYKLVIDLNDCDKYSTLKEAIKNFMARIKENISSGGFSFQALGTACWIESDILPLPMMFYDARDYALDEGWMNEKGEWLV